MAKLRRHFQSRHEMRKITTYERFQLDRDGQHKQKRCTILMPMYTKVEADGQQKNKED
jgi:hypothetical protein